MEPFYNFKLSIQNRQKWNKKSTLILIYLKPPILNGRPFKNCPQGPESPPKLTPHTISLIHKNINIYIYTLLQIYHDLTTKNPRPHHWNTSRIQPNIYSHIFTLMYGHPLKHLTHQPHPPTSFYHTHTHTQKLKWTQEHTHIHTHIHEDIYYRHILGSLAKNWWLNEMMRKKVYIHL